MRSQKRAACTASRQPAVKPAYSVQRQCVLSLRGERALAPACRADETKLLTGGALPADDTSLEESQTHTSSLLSGQQQLGDNQGLKRILSSSRRWCELLVVSSGGSSSLLGDLVGRLADPSRRLS